MLIFLMIGSLFSCPLTVFSSFHGKNPEKISHTENRFNQILQTVPKAEATIGVLLLYKKNRKEYLLLAREREDGPGEKAGTFSDLGGKTQRGTFLENALRELKEESAGLFNFSSVSNQKNILEKSIIILKINPQTKRKIVYLIYPIKPQDFKSCSALNNARERLKQDIKTPSSYLEKDLYLWVDLEDLCDFSLGKLKAQDSLLVHTLEGTSKVIRLRSFFIKDFLRNKTFQKICTSKF